MTSTTIIDEDIREFGDAYAKTVVADVSLLQKLFDRVREKLHLDAVCLIENQLSRYEFRYEIVSEAPHTVQHSQSVIIVNKAEYDRAVQSFLKNKVMSCTPQIISTSFGIPNNLCFAYIANNSAKWLVDFERPGEWTEEDKIILQKLAHALTGFISQKRMNSAEANLDQLFVSTLSRFFHASLSLDLTTGTYIALHIAPWQMAMFPPKGNFDELMLSVAKIIHQNYEMSFLEKCQTLALKKYFATGSDTFNFPHQIFQDGTFKWHSIHSVCYERAENGIPLKAFVMVEDITEQKERELRMEQELEVSRKTQEYAEYFKEVVDALLEQYSTVCGLKLDSEKLDFYKLHDNVISTVGEKNHGMNYSEALNCYVDSGVYPEDREMVRQFLSLESLEKQLKNAVSFTRFFRNQKGKYGEVKAVRIRDNAIMLGFAEKNKEISEYNQKLYEDSLTKVHNRKYLDEKLFSCGCEGLVMLDIDNFKGINDTEGHLCGDCALAEVAKSLKACVRSSDYVVRYGGDEFLVVFPKIQREILKNKMDTMRAVVQKIQLKDYPNLRLSMSLGGVCEKGFVKDLISKADMALYESKKIRNCVTVK